MTRSPLEHFFGLAKRPTALTILGLSRDRPPSVADIDAAAKRRLAEINAHADARTPEAEEARRAIAVAAARLRGAVVASERPRSHGNGHPSMHLTPFDQQVLTVLVASGGWNAESRGRVVALAGQYGVSVQGLLKVIQGLSEHARQGGVRLDVTDILGGATRASRGRGETPIPAPIVRPKRLRKESLGTKVIKRLGIDTWRSPIPVHLLLPLLIVIITIVLGGVVTWVLLKPRPEPGSGGGAGAGSSPVTAAPTDGSAPVEPAPRDPTQAPDLARFRRLPTFTGNALPMAATDAADQAPALPAYFDEIDRKLSVSRDASDAVLRSWDESVMTMSLGWVLADQSTREHVHRTILSILDVVADTPAVSDLLLREITPPSGRLQQPIDLWRGAWLAGTLGAIAGHESLPPVVTEQARLQLELVLGETLPDDAEAFTPAAALWLDAAVEHLVATTEVSEDVYDEWELWIAAHRELGDMHRMHESIMLVVRELLRSGGDLVREGPSVNVLGRVLFLAGFPPSEVLRDGLLAMLEDEAFDATDLWVLTSLLASHDGASWYTTDLVLPPTAGSRLRRRMGDRIADMWPQLNAPSSARLAAGRGISVNANVHARWSLLRDALASEPMTGGERESMGMILATARLNTSAALLCAHRSNEAHRQLDPVQDALANMGAVPDDAAPVRPGQPLGPDGVWAAEYEKLARSGDDRLDALRSLRNTAGTDLGRTDARLLVREAYRGSPRDVRSAARATILEHFRRGPNIGLELLDQLPQAGKTPQLNEFIGGLTDRLLPPARSTEWGTEARLALVEHLLALRPRGRDVVDRIADQLAASLLLSTRAILGSDLAAVRVSAGQTTPASSISELYEAWREHAGGLMVTEPVPAPLPELSARHQTRLRLSRGPVQAFVATQIAIADLLAFIAAAEQPGKGPEIRQLLDDSLDQRIGAGNILNQSLEVERLIARLWSIRMTADPTVGEVE